MPRITNRNVNPHTHLQSDIEGGVGNVASFSALDFLPTNTADWAVGTTGQVQTRPSNNALSVYSLDDTTEEGFGTTPILVPDGTVSLTVTLFFAARTAPAVPSTVGLKIYGRPTEGSVGAWNSVVLADGQIPASTDIVEYVASVSLASLGLSADQLVQLEVTRIAPSAGTNLVGDLDVVQMVVSF